MSQRWYCAACTTAGWSADGSIPPHDIVLGRPCRVSGQLTEREAKQLVAKKIAADAAYVEWQRYRSHTAWRRYIRLRNFISLAENKV